MFNPYANNQIFITSLDEKNQRRTYDISTLVSTIQYTTVLEGQAGKLIFQLQKDPNGILNMYNGSIVQFYRDGKGIFYGYVFNMGTDAKEVYQVVAYDQLRYLKNQETILIKDMRVDEVFKKLCTNLQIPKFKVVVPCDYVCASKVYEGQTLFNILLEQMHRADNYFNKNKSSNQPMTRYCLRDNFGVLEFTELSKLKTNLTIGEKSLLTSYQYEISIDKDTYNQVKLIKKYTSENEKGQKSDSEHIVPYLVKDSGTQLRWGVLQKVIDVDEHLNKAQISELGDNQLKAFNRESKTLKLSALGVDGINAGSGIRVNIPKLRTNTINEKGERTKNYIDMWVTGASHTYNKGMHTMELDVAIP